MKTYRHILCEGFSLLLFTHIVFAQNPEAASSPAPAVPAPPVVNSVSFPSLGHITPRSTHEIKSSNWSIGGEVLDRDYADYNEYKKYLDPLGAKAIRLQAGWAKTEKTKGVYDWQWLDVIVDDAIARGLNPWIQLSYGNPIYPDGGTILIGSPIPTSDEAKKAWDAWALALIHRYKDRVHTWEIWNESDIAKSVPLENYVELYIRTAEIIRKESPDSKIIALSLAYNSEYADHFLDQMAAQGKLDLVKIITFHHYPYNPDDLSTLEKLKKIVAKHGQPIELREGENGAPSTRTTGALSKASWTTLSQAKWDLRRMLAFHGNGVPYNLFTICDFLYPKGMNTKGLLEAGPDHKVVGPKPSYSAAQNVFSIFDDTLKLASAIEIKTDSTLPLAVYGYTKDGTGSSVVSLWEKGAAPAETNVLHSTNIDVSHAHFEKPVYVDLISGEVFAIPQANWSLENGVYHFKGIPLYDSPILIADKSAFLFGNGQSKNSK